MKTGHVNVMADGNETLVKVNILERNTRHGTVTVQPVRDDGNAKNEILGRAFDVSAEFVAR